MRKFRNVLPLEDAPEDAVVVLPLELELEPPHPAATSASPAAAKAAVVTSHPLLRVKWVPPRSIHLCASARGRFFQTAIYRRWKNGFG
jgi:hypothetical protein